MRKTLVSPLIRTAVGDKTDLLYTSHLADYIQYLHGFIIPNNMLYKFSTVLVVIVFFKKVDVMALNKSP
jgi:hypothetical protein